MGARSEGQNDFGNLLNDVPFAGNVPDAPLFQRGDCLPSTLPLVAGQAVPRNDMVKKPDKKDVTVYKHSPRFYLYPSK
jgi:hypothetical protein